MCRWLAYSGDPIFIDELVTRPAHSLVEQSHDAALHYRADGSIWATNGDGFGVGWYNEKPMPGLFKDKMPAWNDENLHEICAQTKAHIFFAHVRASTNGGVQRSNSHPFKYKNWLFQHNGDVNHFVNIKRDLHMDIAPHLYSSIKGTTDSETCFYLLLTYGFAADPKAAVQKMIRRIEYIQNDHGLDVGLNLSCAISDGDKIYTIRYASGTEKIKSQFYSTDIDCFQDFNNTRTEMPRNGVVIVSEPLDRLGSERWIETPKNSFSIVENGQVKSEDLNI